MKKSVKIIIVIFIGVSIGFTYYIFSTLDGLFGFIKNLYTEDNTIYAKDYSENKYRQIKAGMNENQVMNILGKPNAEFWRYSKSQTIHIVNDKVYDIFVRKIEGIKKDMSKKEIIKIVGEPEMKKLSYSSGLRGYDYRYRFVIITEGKVARLQHGYFSQN